MRVLVTNPERLVTAHIISSYEDKFGKARLQFEPFGPYLCSYLCSDLCPYLCSFMRTSAARPAFNSSPLAPTCVLICVLSLTHSLSIVCQKRPIACQKRPLVCQKRPLVCQKRPIVCQKRPIVCSEMCAHTHPLSLTHTLFTLFGDPVSLLNTNKGQRNT